MEKEERRAVIEKTVNELPLEQKEVLIMKIWGELTLKQIAAGLGIPAGTAASRYRYALEALRKKLETEPLSER